MCLVTSPIVALQEWRELRGGFGQLSFMHAYTNLHGRPPAESDIAAALCVSPPSVNQMVRALEKKRLLVRQPVVPRSIRVLVADDEIPRGMRVVAVNQLRMRQRRSRETSTHRVRSPTAMAGKSLLANVRKEVRRYRDGSRNAMLGVHEIGEALADSARTRA